MVSLEVSVEKEFALHDKRQVFTWIRYTISYQLSVAGSVEEGQVPKKRRVIAHYAIPFMASN
jgi:hypothetical protein